METFVEIVCVQKFRSDNSVSCIWNYSGKWGGKDLFGGGTAATMFLSGKGGGGVKSNIGFTQGKTISLVRKGISS